MSRIQILSDDLVNKIAAGEVIERPASIVKELVENAIDAKSTKIRIEIEQGGTKLIRVSDNGIGMSQDEMLLSIKRYATSKIRSVADLESIETLGFRGEALPSIAAVSKFELITRESSADSAVKVQMEGGKIESVSSVGAPFGTMVTAGDLFFNIPARKKFLKSVSTEFAHIAETTVNLALGFPSIQFRLIHNNKEIKNLPAVDNPYHRVIGVIGKDSEGKMLEVDNISDQVHVSGWISIPEIARNVSKIYFYVNGRCVRDKTIQHALMEGYRGTLMKGQFPIAVLFISIPPDQVDINVHPAKHEIRFVDQRIIHEVVTIAVRKALKNAVALPWENKIEKNFVPIFGESETNTKTDREALIDDLLSNVETHDQASLQIASNGEKSLESTNEPTNELLESQSYQNPKNISFLKLRPIGQIRNTYIVCEDNDGIIFIDQHAAHERILFEQIKKLISEKNLPVQQYLIPETIELGYKITDNLIKLMPSIKKLGIEIEHFGGNTFVVKAAPVIIADKPTANLIREIAESDEIDRLIDVTRIFNHIIERMACHGAIRSGQALNAEEIKGLLSQLDKCERPGQCPHGRPTCIRWSFVEMEKNFKRIV